MNTRWRQRAACRGLYYTGIEMSMIRQEPVQVPLYKSELYDASHWHAEPCHEVVYEDETIRLERLWKWNIGKIKVDETGLRRVASVIEEDEETGLLRVAFGDKQEKFALASVEGELICPAVFDDIGDFCEGLARVGIYDEERDKILYGFINQKAEIVIPAIYEDACDFEDGRALVLMQRESKRAGHDNGYKLQERQTEGWFYINKTGKPFLCDAEGPKYPVFGEFHEGMCRVSTIMLNKNDLVYHQQYDDPCNDAEHEHEPGVWGFVNEAGEEVITPKFIFAGDFHNGVAVACKGKWVYKEDWQIYGGDEEKGYWTEEEMWGVIDKEGNEVIPFVYKYVIRCKGEDGAEDIFTVRYGDMDNPRWGVVDARGNWLAKSDNRNIIADSTPTKDGLFCFYEEDWPFPEWYTCGIYDSRKNTVLFETSPRNADSHRNAYISRDGTILLVETDKKGDSIAKIVERNGNEKFPSNYSWIDIDTKPYTVGRDKKGDINSSIIGFIDENGKVLLPCTYEVDNPYDDNIFYKQRRFVFIEEGLRGIADFDGNVLISPKYEGLFDIDRPLVTFQKQPEWGPPWGLVTPDGREVLPDEFDVVEWCADNRHILCRRNGTYEMFLLTEKSKAGNAEEMNDAIFAG